MSRTSVLKSLTAFLGALLASALITATPAAQGAATSGLPAWWDRTPIMPPRAKCPGVTNPKVSDIQASRIVACVLTHMRRKNGRSRIVVDNLSKTAIPALKKDLTTHNRICRKQGWQCGAIVWKQIRKTKLYRTRSTHLLYTYDSSASYPVRLQIENSPVALLEAIVKGSTWDSSAGVHRRELHIFLKPQWRRVAVVKVNQREPGARSPFDPRTWEFLPTVTTRWNVILST